jgi:hypothetical protein
MIPIPASCGDRPTVGGLVAPFINIRLADGGVDFRSPHNKSVERCWVERLCQTCGKPLVHRAYLFGGPRQVSKRHFDEPPLCVPCAVYASQACPMVAGRQPFYADRERLVDTRRGHRCADVTCGCGGFIDTFPDSRDVSGEPAHAWYALLIRPGQWTVTVTDVEFRCSDRVCTKLHSRRVVNGAFLAGNPLKIMVVSRPGEGRIWRRATPAETAGLLSPEQASTSEDLRT